MKAKFILSSMLFAAFGMLFTACDSDRDDNPTLGLNHTATEFVVNTSALADQYIQLTPDNTVNLTWTQPNYGVNTVVNYKVQVGLKENGTEKWGDYLETGFTSCNVNISGEEIAKAICKLDGFKTEDDYVDMGFREVVMRVAASIKTTSSQLVEGTDILSNTVSFKHLAAYCMVPTKGTLYVIGSCCGWPEPSGSNKQTLIDGGWCLMYDCYRNGHYQFTKSEDLQTFTFVQNTETKGHFTPRHGTVIQISRKEYKRLMQAFPPAND
jgi:hypothetical protein